MNNFIYTTFLIILYDFVSNCKIIIEGQQNPYSCEIDRDEYNESVLSEHS